MSSFNVQPAVIVIGASAGGLEPLMEIVRSLPADLPAAVCVVVHFPATANSLLPQILGRVGKLPAAHPEDGQPFQAGCLYTARPDRHLMVVDQRLALSRGPRQNGHRPAIDPLFQSAARSQGPRVIGVILSGTLDDGSLGLQMVKAYGGATLVQDPHSALFAAMPANALAAAEPDLVLPPAEIGPALVRLAHERAQLPHDVVDGRWRVVMTDKELPEHEEQIVADDKHQVEIGARPGETTLYTCPDCGGVLWEIQEAGLLRYRCHVGHAYSADGLRAKQSDELEEALWEAIRRLEESASLARRLAFRARESQNFKTAEHFEQRAVEDEERAGLVRRALLVQAAPPDSEVAALDSGSGTAA